MIDERIRQALEAYEQQHGTTRVAHARLLGVGQMTLSDFLNRRTGLGVRLARRIKRVHPELLYLLIAWLDEGAEEGGDVVSRRG